MANDSKLVHSGRGNANGVLYRAALGSTLPTDASTALDAAFKPLGYVSEEGITQTQTVEAEDVREMNGRIVKTLDTDVTDTFSGSLIQSGDPEVLKAVYGDDAVDDADPDEIVLSFGGEVNREPSAWVIELAEGDHKRRVVYAEARVSGNEDVSFTRGEVIQYGITVTAYPSSALGGASSKAYISKNAPAV